MAEQSWKPVQHAFKRLRISTPIRGLRTTTLRKAAAPTYGIEAAASKRRGSLEATEDIFSRDTQRDFRDLSREAFRGIQESEKRQRARPTEDVRLTTDERARRDGLERLAYRRWQSGDVYAPHDLTSAENIKARKRRSNDRDMWDVLGIKENDVYKNFAMLAEYTTPMGRIKKRSETGLRPVNQRKMARAVRRAIGLGIIPRVHHHPEIMEMREALRETRGR